MNEGRKLVVQVVTVVTRLIRQDFFRHHLTREVVTEAKVVTGSNAKGAPVRMPPVDVVPAVVAAAGWRPVADHGVFSARAR
jgi:hypothetical protein